MAVCVRVCVEAERSSKALCRCIWPKSGREWCVLWIKVARRADLQGPQKKAFSVEVVMRHLKRTISEFHQVQSRGKNYN